MSQDGADTLATIRKWAWVWRWARDMCHTRGARLRPTTPVIITNSHCRTSKTILQKYFICQNYLKLACHWLVGDDHWGGSDKNKVTDVNDDTNDEDDDEVSGDIHLIYRQEVSSWLSTATKDQLKPAPLAWTIYTWWAEWDRCQQHHHHRRSHQHINTCDCVVQWCSWRWYQPSKCVTATILSHLHHSYLIQD